MSLNYRMFLSGTTADWTRRKHWLRDGEMGFDRTLKMLKIGDGATLWSSLDPLELYVVPEVALATPGATVLTTVDTVVMSLLLPADSLAVGSTFRVSYVGVCGATSVVTYTLRVGPLGTIADTALVSVTGATGTTQIVQLLSGVTEIGEDAEHSGGGSVQSEATTTGTVVSPSGTFDSTVANYVTLSAQSTTSNTHTVRAGTLEVLQPVA